MLENFEFIVEEEFVGQRVDKFLALKAPELSRSRIKDIVEKGNLICNGKSFDDVSRKVKLGDTFALTIPEAEPSDMQARSDIEFGVVYEDDDLMVINKPAGLTTHPGAGNHQETLANALLGYLGENVSSVGGVMRPGIVHRLDKDTSGLMVVAKNDQAHHSLSAQIASRELSRIYYAVVWGVPNPVQGYIEGNIIRSHNDRTKMMVTATGGKEAVTNYKVLKVFGGHVASLVECKLETGRTHQIRAHFSHIGNSLVGDQKYGHNARKISKVDQDAKDIIREFKRQALHSKKIAFEHPKNKKLLEFEIDLPEDMANLINRLSSL